MKFFDFDYTLDQPANWIFSINHLLLFIFFLVAIFTLYFVINPKTKRGIVTAKIVLILLLVFLEFGRMWWTYLSRVHQGLETPFNEWIRIWSFEVCAIMVWVIVGTLVASLFVPKDNRTMIIVKNIMFGAATMGAFLTFVFPNHIDPYKPVLHWRNTQTIIQHLLLIYVPFFFMKIGEIDVKVKNIWMPVLGYFGVASINITAAHLSGINFFGALNDRHAYIMLGFPVPHPLNYIVIFAVSFLGTCVLYFGHHFITGKHKMPKELTRKKQLIAYLPYFTGAILAITMLYVPMLLGSDFSEGVTDAERSLSSWTALFIMLPFIIQVILMYQIDNKRPTYDK